MKIPMSKGYCEQWVFVFAMSIDLIKEACLNKEFRVVLFDGVRDIVKANWKK